MTPTTEMEQKVWNLFVGKTTAAYQAQGCCAHCHAPAFVVGRKPSARICVECFEQVFRNTHPTVRALAGRAQ